MTANPDFGCPCPETPGKTEWLAKRREVPKVVKAVVPPGATRAHLVYETHDTPDADGDYDETWRGFESKALCGELLPMKSAFGGLHERYCQSCVAKLGAREIAP